MGNDDNSQMVNVTGGLLPVDTWKSYMLAAHKGLKKRVKVTAKGKIKRGVAGGGHLLSGKSSKRKRAIRNGGLVVGKIAAKTRILLGK